MNHPTEVHPADLARFAPFLRVQARLVLDRRLRGKLEADDVVQDTLLEAQRSWAQFRGAGDAELAGWLRTTLLHKLAHALRDFTRAKRDVHRECSLEEATEASSANVEAWLAAEQSSPSERAQRNEEAVRLAAALEKLPDLTREAVVLRHLEGRPVAEVARRLGKTVPAVAGLLHRGLQQLQGLLPELRGEP